MGMRKKYESGAATNYISRRQALTKLQLNLRDFRRLCIIKGIHPHEPRHKKKVNKGSNVQRTWYFAKDIQFLAHEPLINKFREFKVFLKRLHRAKVEGDQDEVNRVSKTRPLLKYDRIVKESDSSGSILDFMISPQCFLDRYPTFMDAIRDLEDALCLCFLFAKLKKKSRIPSRIPHMCRRLTVEFMHFVIETKALRKVFVSIKGVYYQAEIMGQTTTWITPHERAIEENSDVDMSVMVTFADFYITFMGFVNFRLYKDAGLFYPPKLGRVNMLTAKEHEADKEASQELIFSLSEELGRDSSTAAAQEPAMDEFPEEESGMDTDVIADYKRVRSVQKLFAGLKFFLSREVPRESLTFVIRACGGLVSWDSSVEYGSSYPESDETITHQIVDRPNQLTSFINRSYVQPQWVYDCVNAGLLLPVQSYFLGVELPPHLSPFAEEKEGDYIPRVKVKLLQLQGKDVGGLLIEDMPKSVDSTGVALQGSSSNIIDEPKAKRRRKRAPALAATPGAPAKQTREEAIVEKAEQRKLQEIMIPKKYRRVYKKIKYGQKRKAIENRTLLRKRQALEQG
ncbi:pescadillo protein [Trichuris trichiura]|uniref:Pescadillo homolog n=1 Tax=Trichuris trichiura TaxID=36087 RepID=A0A077ZBN5_TRITR|nr:pescadillo protein [Trichuris trichiura]